MVLSLLPDRSTERERGRQGREEGHRGGPVQERGVFCSKTQSFGAGDDWKERLFGFFLGGGWASSSAHLSV